MRTNKKLRTVILCMLILVMTFISACSKGNSSDKQGGHSSGDKTLHVAAINKGYGTVWLEAMLEEFCRERGWEYVLYPVYDDGEMTQKIEAGEQVCNYDLVFTGATSIASAKYLLDLSDVLDSQIEAGERKGKKISECIDSTVYNALADKDGNIYRMPWTGGVNGLIYNNAAITKVMGDNWQEQYPCRTTSELLDFCKALKKNGLSPFIHAADTNYYSFLYEAWFAQYNGTEGMKDYFSARYVNYLGETEIGYGVARNEGVLESAKVMESIFSNGYSHEKSNSIDWEVTQTLFMTGEAAMFSNGDWHNIEMMKQFPDSDVRFMKVPIISALATKLGINDEQLAAVTEYVDGKGEKPSVSSSNYTEEQIIDIVKDARSWVASYADAHNVFVVKYSPNTAMAKEFLKFMVSDDGQHIFSEKTNGLTMCYGYNLENDDIYSGLSHFAKSRWEVAKNAQFYIMSREEAFSKAGLEPFKARTKGPLENLLSRSNDRYTAQMIYDYDYSYYKDNWNVIQSNAK